MVGERVTIQGLVRHGRDMVLPVLVGAHAAAAVAGRRRLITRASSLIWSLYYDRVNRVPRAIIMWCFDLLVTDVGAETTQWRRCWYRSGKCGAAVREVNYRLYAGLFVGKTPPPGRIRRVSKCRGSSQVGSGQETFEMSRVGSSRVNTLSILAGRVGSGRVKRFQISPVESGHDP